MSRVYGWYTIFKRGKTEVTKQVIDVQLVYHKIILDIPKRAAVTCASPPQRRSP